MTTNTEDVQALHEDYKTTFEEWRQWTRRYLPSSDHPGRGLSKEEQAEEERLKEEIWSKHDRWVRAFLDIKK